MTRLHLDPPADNSVLESEVEATLRKTAAEGVEQPDLYVLREELSLAEKALSLPFNELVERAQVENLSL